MAFSTMSSPSTISIFTFGKKSTTYSAPRYNSVALLTAEALGLGNRYSLQTHFLQRLLHLIELEWFDDRLDFFHRVPSPGSRTRRNRSRSDLWLAGPVPM